MNLAKKTFGFAQFILVTFVLTFSAHAAGEVDTGFLANLTVSSGRISKILVQPDGKTLVGGNFRVAGGYTRIGMFRLNVDGTIDTSFQPPPFANSNGIGGTVNVIALQSDGKILVGGDFLGANNIQRPGLMRLNANGSMDLTFASLLNSNHTISDILVLPDDRILIAGNFTLSGDRIGIARLNPNGTLDSIVYQNIIAISKLLLLPDGKLILASSTNIRRFNVDGTFDPTYNTITIGGGSVLDMELLPDGKILIAGSFTLINGFNLRALFRSNADGSVDGTFNGAANLNSSISGITPTPSGKYLIFGSFTTYGGVARNRAAVIDANGTLDTTFNIATNNFSTISDMQFAPDGKIFIGGFVPSLSKLNTDGTFDTTFSVQLGSVGAAYAIAVQPDGKVIVGGQFSLANGVSRGSLARFNVDGSLDTTFIPPNINISWGVYDIEIQPDGKIIVPIWIGSSGFTYRLNPNGSIDTQISNTPNSYDATSLPDGKFLISHGDRVKRYNSNATLDNTFTTNVATNDSSGIYKMAVMPNGKIIVSGRFTTIGGQTRGRIALLNADGTLDSTFNPLGGANANINIVASQPDGKILIGGDFTGVNFDGNKKYLARLNDDGTLDTSFAPVLNAPVLGLKVQPNGKILIGGSFNVVNGVLSGGIARLNPNGSNDASFNIGAGTNSTVWGVDFQNDKIVYAGQFSATNGISTLGIGRLLNASVPQSTLFDYDGDGKADVSVFRPSENRWYIFRSSDGVIAQTAFAITDDKPVPADFDGDGKTDIAIFRPASGDWWSLSSSNNAQITANLGNASDIKLPSDFDGDGRADYVIFRPSNNVWYRLSSATGTSSNVTFGLAGDKPVMGDFDGDGKSDVAIYRPSTGDWWYQSSINGAQLATRWGISTDIPTPADFDGDGKTDFAVYRASTGVWYIYNSSTGNATIMAFGLSEDKPIAADYDGDGKADIAVFRPSTGIWYQMRSTAGFGATQFGISTDIPTPNAFVP